MRFTDLFTRTVRENPADETSSNAQLLKRAGFIYKNSAGIYTYLPLGWRVLQKIAGIIREEMDAIGGVELFMPVLHDKHYLQATNRWNVDIIYKVITDADPEPHFNISWTHEEMAAEIATEYISSYQNLPQAFYQIQGKFRHEPRAKSGLLRGREFMMKDLYSFHADEADLTKFYALVKDAYHKIFERCGLRAIYTLAAGGEFTASNTHEFQVPATVGEDTIYVCSKCQYAENAEISKLKVGEHCPKCNSKMEESKSIEVGNIFPLGTKYSEAFNLQYVDEAQKKKYVVMGSYGIGLGRVMGAAVEVHHDEKGIIWPESIAPYRVHLVALTGGQTEADKLYQTLTDQKIEVLYDDRADQSAGEKFADADLLGCPLRLVVSKKTLAEKSVELKRRSESEGKLIGLTEIMAVLELGN